MANPEQSPGFSGKTGLEKHNLTDERIEEVWDNEMSRETKMYLLIKIIGKEWTKEITESYLDKPFADIGEIGQSKIRGLIAQEIQGDSL